MPRTRACAVAAGLAGLALAGPGLQPASAAGTFTSCKQGRALCGSVVVPLARDGRLQGKVSLAVRMYRARKVRRGTLLLLSGGPGQAVLDYLDGVATLPDSVLGDVGDAYDLLAFDVRGTGRSGVLRCPEIERVNLLYNGPEAELCARRLGPRRDYYQTRDAVADLEAVRAALRIPRLSIYGVSYGTHLALTYAYAHPARIQRLVMDSVELPGRRDPFYRAGMRATPRLLRNVCRTACARLGLDSVADLRTLVARIGSERLRGPIIGRDGRTHAASLAGGEMIQVLSAGDFVPTLRTELPGALRSAVTGDPAPLLRMGRAAVTTEGVLGDPREYSPALYAANTCAEHDLPWAPSTPVASRLAEAQGRVTALGPAAFGPFDAAAALDSDFLKTCSRWPSPARPPAAHRPSSLAGKPVLILSGLEDFRTPMEDGRRLAATLDSATVVTFPGVGHAALNQSACSTPVVERFLAGRAPGRCTRNERTRPPTRPAPRSLAEVAAPRPAAGPAGRAGCAVALTLLDARLREDDHYYGAASRRPPGLRGGIATIVRTSGPSLGRFTLSGYSYVPGVAVSGAPARGSLRVIGDPAAAGSVRVTAGGALVGRLGGSALRTRFGACMEPAYAKLLLDD